MKAHKRITSLLLVFGTVWATTLMAVQSHDKSKLEGKEATAMVMRQQDQTAMPPTEEAANQLPIAEAMAPEPTDSEKKALRRLRNSRHDIKDRAANVERFKLKEDSPPILIQLQSSHAPAEAALPVDQSDTIVIGEATEAQAYLSNDKTRVYSEFTVRVDEVLKNDSTAPLNPGALITAERPGGRVRFPSGKILVRSGLYGRNMPRIGRKYALFLKHNSETQDFSVLTGYELRSGHVFPLDRKPEGGSLSPQFTNYESYSGKDEAIFMKDLQGAIATSTQKTEGQK